ncbi:type II toxin-antitoxin system HipA family toxin [Granulicella paludicola]|uniref:type II toxin-antitoxin system HipA family toxin n=1 Tax=Granulicella paludicola TaxID=474951 RepID=UPI0021E00F4F|nr:type II toxin-antitoxin system HipA family toxin [Granulicella paludicola]
MDVYLQSDLVGHLSQDTGGQMRFQYVESWLDGSGAAPLSQSLPLRKERFSQKECRGYFGGILPEASNREVVARNLGISARNDFAMLEEIGGECAGAVTFVPTGDRLQENRNSDRTLSSSELADVLRELRKRPLLAGQEGIRQSLAGAQDKVAVCLSGDEISLPLDGAPSTHVLKPAVERFEGVVQNESLCMRLATAIGLPTAKVQARSVEGMDFLLVERYDRVCRKGSIHEPAFERLHQEDFCQALGIVSEMKYQNEGGPSLKQCFALLRKVSSAPAVDLARLLDAVIFNYLVGNNDAHGKNFSLLYRGLGRDDAHVGLAPLYDILSTVYYPELSRTMAMKLGGEYSSEKVWPHNFEQLAEDAGLEKSLVLGRVAEMVEEIRTVLPQMHSDGITRSIAARILQRCELSQGRFQR